MVQERFKKFKAHGLSNTRLYRIWYGMKQRCYNPKNTRYKNYGGRNITVCDEWENDFISFYNWAIYNGYNDNLTIDRIDVNGNYKPDNCRFIDQKTQQRNRSNNHLITYNGKTHCINEWAEILGFSKYVIQNRILRDKWDIERAFTKPIRRQKASHQSGGVEV